MINILDRINKLYNKNELIIQIEKSIKPKEIIDIKPADIKLISKHFDDYKKIETLLGPSSLATYEIEGRTILFSEIYIFRLKIFVMTNVTQKSVCGYLIF